jgi:micrococcal nuclease
VRAALVAVAAAAVLTSCESGPVAGDRGATTESTPQSATALVARVIDGDTIEVLLAGRIETVRLLGINANESGECFSTQASSALADLVGGRDVVLVPDRSERDQYGRLLRYVYVDGIFVNEAMVDGGLALAVSYQPDTTWAEDLERAQQDAKAARRGLWALDACGSPLLPEGAVVISDLVCNAPGNDAENLNGEWAQILNAGDSGIDLTGWVLKDESSSNRYRFPDHFVLSPNATTRVHSGSGIDAAADLYWGNATSAVWNNGGDTAFLLDPNGNVVSTHPCG